jgi:SAM-dependent methyltransferase
MLNPFENPTVANSYDSFYENPVGALYDRLEKAAIQRLLIEKFPTLHTPDFSARLLEIGSGTGHWSRLFAELGFNVLGIEPSLPMIAIANGKHIPNTEFLNHRGEDFILKPNNPPFDALAFITSLEFMDNPVAVIQNSFRYLKKHGTIIVGVLNENSTLGINRKKEQTVYTNAHFYEEAELKTLFAPFGSVHTLQSAFAEPDQLASADEIEQQAQAKGASNGKFIACRIDVD